jgi:hypothetical protein
MPSRASKKHTKRPNDPNLLARTVIEDLIGENPSFDFQNKKPFRVAPMVMD